jgi:hypothetical protein
MLMELNLPLINAHMVHARVDSILVRSDRKIAVGQPILELTVDLSDQFPHDCPPVSCYRLCTSEAAWLRQLAIAAGDMVAVGALVATFSSTAEEALERAASRALRTTVVGIMREWQPW